MPPIGATREGDLSPRAEELAARFVASRGAVKKACQQLAHEITRRRDSGCVSALIELLQDESTAVNAARVLKACGESAPSLLVPHADVFLGLINSGEGWIVRAALDSLGWVCQAAPDVLWPRREELIAAFEAGSERTRDSAVAILTTLAGSSPTRRGHLSPMLLELLRECGRKSLPTWAEQMLPVLSGRARAKAERVLAERLDELKPTGRRRVEKLLR